MISRMLFFYNHVQSLCLHDTLSVDMQSRVGFCPRHWPSNLSHSIAGQEQGNGLWMQECVCGSALSQLCRTGAEHDIRRREGPKAGTHLSGARPCERRQGDSWSQLFRGGQAGEGLVASSVRMRGKFIWVKPKMRQRSVRQQHFQWNGEGVTLIKYLGLPATGLLVLPRDLSVTLK